MICSLKDNDKIVPVFKNRYIAATFACDDNYIAQTAVMIRSIVDNASDTMNYDIVILSEGINPTNISNVSVIADGRKNISIRFFNISEIIRDVKFYTDNIYTPTKYSKEMYFRLFIPYLMPKYNRVVYFDGDMAAITDIAGLNKIDLGKNLVAATRDYSGIAACYDKSSDRKEYRQSIGLKKLDEYFISSLVIFNIRIFNKNFSIGYIKQLISSRAWRQHDQDILNVLCKSRVKIIDAKWSFFEELDYALLYLPVSLKKELQEAYRSPAVIHYAAERKGWKDDNSDLIKYFWQYAARTNYFDVFNGMLPSDNTSFRSYIFFSVLKRTPQYYYTYDDLVLLSTPYYIGRLSSIKICIEFLYIKNNSVYIDGYFEAIDIIGKLKLYAVSDGKKISVYNSDYYREYGHKSKTRKIRNFNFTTDIYNGKKIEFLLTYDDVHFVKPAWISVEQFAPINENQFSFYCKDGYILTKQNGKILLFEAYSRVKRFSYTKKICASIKERKDRYYKRLANIRWTYTFIKPLFRDKHIWLIGDTISDMSNQTIAFAEYLKKNTAITPYLVVGDTTKKINTSCKVVKAKSDRHKFLYMYAECIVASEYNMTYFQPCFNRSDEVRDIIANKKYILWCKNKVNLNIYVKPWYNVSKFIVENDNDYNAVINGNNGYTVNNVIKIDRNGTSVEEIFNLLLGE